MKQYFHKKKIVTKTVYDNMPISELVKLLNKYKPTEIWHSQYSSKQPFIYITEYDSEGGFMMYVDSLTNKTPEYCNPSLLYKFLKYQGYADCYINTKAINNGKVQKETSSY